jgi:hypothetical protein
MYRQRHCSPWPIRASNFVQTAAVNGRTLVSYEHIEIERLVLRRLSMSRAEEFRQSTEQFWSEMDQKRKVIAADRKPRPTSSGKTLKKLSVGRTSPRPKKRKKH